MTAESELHAQMEALNSKINSLQTHLADQVKKAELANVYKEQIQNQQKKIIQQKEKVESLNREVEALKKVTTTVNPETTHQQNRILKQAKKLNERQIEIDRLNSKVRSLEQWAATATMAQPEEKVLEDKRIQSELAALRERENSLRAENDEKERKISELNALLLESQMERLGGVRLDEKSSADTSLDVESVDETESSKLAPGHTNIKSKIELDQQLDKYSKFLTSDLQDPSIGRGAKTEFDVSPLVSWKAIECELRRHCLTRPEATLHTFFPQFGLLGTAASPFVEQASRNPLFINMNAPWSAFVCGSQGSGKSHTTGCILENALVPDPRLGALVSPLAGLVFYSDPHMNSACEAAHIASAGVKVRVLVSPSNFSTMKQLYSKIPGGDNITVSRLYISPKDLTTDRLKKLMAVEDTSSTLYMESIIRILREMRLENEGYEGVDYPEFLKRLEEEGFIEGQMAMLRLRLMLLESLLDTSGMNLPDIRTMGKRGPKAKAHSTRQRTAVITTRTAFSCPPGTLTIVDLTDPFIDPASACTLFEICLALFLSRSETKGKIVALDEAHNYITDTPAAVSFTNSLLRSIREQRHKALRVIVATQEPTINPALIDLCSITIVHRFTSPAWMRALEGHLGGLAVLKHGKTARSAAASPYPAPSPSCDSSTDGTWDNVTAASALSDTDKRSAVKLSLAPSDFPTVQAANSMEVFKTIMGLQVGEALLFAPSGIVSTSGQKLGSEFIHLRVRPRISNDGGRSKLAVGK